MHRHGQCRVVHGESFHCRIFSQSSLIVRVFCREQLLQVLLRVTEAVMKRPQDNHKRDAFAESLSSILFRVGRRHLRSSLATSQPSHLSFFSQPPDHHRRLDQSQPVRVHLPEPVGRAAGGALLADLLGGAGDGVGRHHGLAHGRAGALRLRPGHVQPAAGQTQRAEGDEAAAAR